MSDATNYVKNLMQLAAFNDVGNPVTMPANWYLGMFTTPTDDDGGGAEVSGGSYERILIPNKPSHWTDGGNGLMTLAQIVQSATPTGNWGQITHLALHDALTAGNMWFHRAANSPFTKSNGDEPVIFDAGSITVQFL